MTYLFTYGVLTHPSYMVGFNGKKAYIKDASLEFNYFITVQKGSDTVYGVLWEISQQKLELLDVAENVPELYVRETVIAYVDDTEVPAFIYTMSDRSRSLYENHEPSSSYLESIQHGYTYFDVPLDQLKIANLVTV